MSGLRDYQRAAADAIDRDLATQRSTIVVMPTGTGKTVLFTEVARRRRESGQRTLVVAHRKELIRQAADKLQRFGGLSVGIEMGDERASATPLFRPDVVVGTVQSFAYASRRESYRPDEFGMLVIDECHHATTPQYLVNVNHFTGAQVLGVTATPDRSDGGGLGSVFQSVAFEYPIRDAINEGYLVPIHQHQILLNRLNLSDVKQTRGDFDEKQLGAIMSEEEHLHGVAEPLVREAGDRQTIVFCPTVKHAHDLAAVIQRYTPNRRVVALDGGSEDEARDRAIAEFMAGEIQILVNCALFTEGFDAPPLSCVAIVRPTRSRSLYTQMVGRGTRLWCPHGCTERYCDHPDAKRNLRVLDFVGASKHKLITAVDILAGDEEPRTLELANQIARGGKVAIHDALEEARRRLAAEKRRSVIARAEYSKIDVDPFSVVGATVPNTYWANDPATEDQLARLAVRKVKLEKLGPLTKGQASALIDAVNRRRDQGLCTFEQAQLLARRGLIPDVSFAEANRILDALRANKWRIPDWVREQNEERRAAGTGGR